MRDRQQEQMTLSFERQRKDFARQMRINAENISTFAQDIGMSFETAFKTVHSRVSGETKKQFEALKQLYDAYNKTIDVKNKLLESTINKPYEALNQFKPFRLVKGGPMLSMGGPGDNSDVAHANALGGGEGTGGGTGNPESGGAHKYDPLHGALHINTPYGKRGSWAAGYHTGVDLRAREGTAVYAAEPGKVVYAGWGGAYGNLTKIAHGDGIQTWYAHQSHIGVRRGETVDGGEKIGNVGHTGRVFPAGPGGAHLHFELRVNGRDRDPMPWLRGASSPSGSKGSPSDAPGSAEMPNWLGMEGVKQWNSFLGDLGVMDRGSLSKYTISNMASNAYAAAYQLAYPGGAPAGAEGDPLTGGSARNNWGSGTGHITPGGKSSAYARRAASILGPKFGFNTVGTYPGHDPTEALALDFMLDKPYSADGKAQGEAAWNYVQKNWRQLGLDYMIFWTKIWNPPGGLRGGRDGSSPVDHDHARHYSGTPNPHKDHVHLSFMPGHAAGVNGATPGWAVVGENGPEYIRMRGGEQVASRTNAKAAIQASNAQQVVSASGVTNNTWDHSVHYEGQMVVMAQDPNELGRKLAEKQRLSALVTARK
jgi:murein DD-endopeptidase MepM/ murein hydrolase activator NlpD